MANKTQQLQSLWWDWLNMSERLLLTLHEQTVGLTLRDAERLDRLQPEIDFMMTKMQSIDDHAAACARKLAEELGTESHLRSLTQALEKAEAQQVQALANRIIVVGRNIQAVIDKNRRLIEAELEYTNGTLALVARAVAEQENQYDPNAKRKVKSAPSIAISEVA